MNIQYRPEIDGLRTIAVMAVIIYHLDIFLGKSQFLKGGFFGVDIFFVISGFLITSIIMKEFSATTSFSITNFYERRVRRLFPALLTVIVFSLPLAWNILQPSQLVDYAKSILSTLAFGSNFYWYGTLEEYGAESALLKPFLHTWTLAVEEQFYIIFPLILVLIHKYFKSHVVVILLAGLLLSLQFSEWMTMRNSSFSFYMLMSRFWELLAGGLLANILYFHPRKENDALLNNTMPVFGLYLILYSIFFIDLSSNHPGFITLVPVIGTVLIIWFGNQNELVTKILSTRLFVAVGLISYSLYLWHYPIFVFGRFIDGTPSLLDKATWLVLTLVFSILTYHLIEKPFRNRNIYSRSSFTVIIVGVTLAVLIILIYFIKADGIKSRFEELIAKHDGIELDFDVLAHERWNILKSIQESYGYEFIYKKKAVDHASESEKNELWYDDLDYTNILIVGNSHSVGMFNAFKLNQELFMNIEVARYAINPFDIDDYADLLASPNFIAADLILIAHRYGSRNQKTGRLQGVEKHIQSLTDFISTLKAQNKKVIVADNTVEFLPYNGKINIVDGLLANKNANPLIINDVNHLYYEMRDLEKESFNRDIRNIANKMGVKYLSKSDYICNDKDELCTGLTPLGKKAFHDYGHYTINGSKHFGQKIHKIDWLKLRDDK